MKNLLFVLCVAFCSSLAAAPAAPRIKDIRISQFDGLNWKDVILHPTNGMTITFDSNRAPSISSTNMSLQVSNLDLFSLNFVKPGGGTITITNNGKLWVGTDLDLFGNLQCFGFDVVRADPGISEVQIAPQDWNLVRVTPPLVADGGLKANGLTNVGAVNIAGGATNWSATLHKGTVENQSTLTNAGAANITGPINSYGGIALTAGNSITNTAGPAIYFGSTNLPTFTAPAGSLYLAGGGGFYVRTNNAWLGK